MNLAGFSLGHVVNEGQRITARHCPRCGVSTPHGVITYLGKRPVCSVVSVLCAETNQHSSPRSWGTSFSLLLHFFLQSSEERLCGIS